MLLQTGAPYSRRPCLFEARIRKVGAEKRGERVKEVDFQSIWRFINRLGAYAQYLRAFVRG